MTTPAARAVPPPQMPQDRLWLPAVVCLLLLAAELYALFSDFDFVTRERRGAGPVIATFRQSAGEVRSRAAGTITWNVPARDSELHREDAVLTMTDAQALVEFTDGAKMSIEPDSLVVLEKAESTASPRIVLKLLEGSLSKQSPGKLPVAIDLVDRGRGTSTRIEDPSGSAVFHLKREDGALSLEVENGTVKIENAQGAQTVAPFQKAKITPEAVRITEVPLRFASLAPNSARTEARESEDEKISLRWEQLAPGGAASDANVKVFVSRHADMSEPRELDADGAKAAFEPDADGTWFWQLASDDGTIRSSVASFVAITKRPPELDGPDDDEEIIIGQPVVFRWKPPRSGAQVFLETSSTGDFSPLLRSDAPAGQNGIESRYETPQTVYWRLRADYGRDAGVSQPTSPRRLVVKARPKLKAPKSIKSKVRIEDSRASAPARTLSWLSWLESEARADEAPQKPRTKKVTVDLEWEAVEGAAQYRLQISTTEDFRHIVLDRQVRNPGFAYKTQQTENDQALYFRIAALDAAGTEGEFSETNSFDIEALPPPEVRIARPEPPKPHPTPTPTPVAVQAPEEKPVLLSVEERGHRSRFQLQLLAGAAYHSRNFKSDTRPLTAQGSALVPAFGALELRRRLGDPAERADDPGGAALALGASLFAEKAEPTNAGVVDEIFPIPLLRAWAALEKPTWGLYGGAGPYATTSQKFSWNGRHAVNQRQVAIGLIGLLGSSQVEERAWHWRTQLALVGSGAKGGDAAGSLRVYLSGRVRAVDHAGLFAQGEVFVRYLDIETSYAAILEIGYAL